MTTTKKTILTLGTIAAVTAPIIAVVSCGSEEKSKPESKAALNTQKKAKDTIKNQEAIKDLLTTIGKMKEEFKKTKAQLVGLKDSTTKSNAKFTKDLADQKLKMNNELESVKDAAKALEKELKALEAKQNTINRREFNEKKLNALITAKENEIRELGTHNATVENTQKIAELQKELDKLILQRFKSVSKTAKENVQKAKDEATKKITAIQTKLDEALKKIAQFEKSKADKVAAQKSEKEANETQKRNDAAVVLALDVKNVKIKNAELTATKIAHKIKDRASLKTELNIDITNISGSTFTISAKGETNGTITITVTMKTINATTPEKTETLIVKHASDANIAAKKTKTTQAGKKTQADKITNKSSKTKTTDKSKTVKAKAHAKPTTPITSIYLF